MIEVVPSIGEADIMNDQLTHEESQGVLKDILERFSSYRGRLWHQAIKRLLVGKNTDFYMLEIGDYGNIRNLLQKFSQAGFSISPFGGEVEQSLRASNPRQLYGLRECFRMLPVRAMEFERTNAVTHETQTSAIAHIGLMDDCVATSWEGACKLLLELYAKQVWVIRRKTLLEMSPAPIVWTFVGGEYENRFSLAATEDESKRPLLVGLVSEDAGLGFRGIADASYLFQQLGRKDGEFLTSDVFVFSIRI